MLSQLEFACTALGQAWTADAECQFAFQSITCTSIPTAVSMDTGDRGPETAACQAAPTAPNGGTAKAAAAAARLEQLYKGVGCQLS